MYILGQECHVVLICANCEKNKKKKYFKKTDTVYKVLLTSLTMYNCFKLFGMPDAHAKLKQ